VAYVPQDILDRIKALENEVRTLRGRAQIRPALNQVLNGDTVIGEGGQFIVRAPGGVEHLRVGDLYNTSNGVREFGLEIRRRDGSNAITLYNGSTDAEQPQALRLLDANGKGLLVEDVTAGGLYRPWLPYPELANDDVTTWPSVTGTTWTTVEQGNALCQHPRVQALVSIAGTGSIRLQIDDQTVLSATSNVIQDVAEVPGYVYGKEINIKVQARAATASGTVRAKTRYLYGVGSA
jgi:hypothetical protein